MLVDKIVVTEQQSVSPGISASVLNGSQTGSVMGAVIVVDSPLYPPPLYLSLPRETQNGRQLKIEVASNFVRVLTKLGCGIFRPRGMAPVRDNRRLLRQR